jgi:glutamine synthetase
MMAGFENEFFLRKKVVSGEKELWVPFDNTPYCSTTAFDGASSVLQEVYTSLKAAEIVVEQVSSFIIFVRRYF